VLPGIRTVDLNQRLLIQAPAKDDDKARALRVVVTEHDVVLGIFPSAEGIGLHVIKGEELLRQIASSNSVGDYTHTAVAVALQQVLAAASPHYIR
jgi:hypothetical protein